MQGLFSRLFAWVGAGKDRDLLDSIDKFPMPYDLEKDMAKMRRIPPPDSVTKFYRNSSSQTVTHRKDMYRDVGVLTDPVKVQPRQPDVSEPRSPVTRRVSSRILVKLEGDRCQRSMDADYRIELTQE